MPQGKRLTIDEALRLPAPARPKPVSIDEALKLPVATRPQPTNPAPPIPTGQNVAVGAAGGYLGLTNPIEAAGDIIAGLATGDTRPLKEAGKRLALGVGRTYAQAGLAPGAEVALDAAIEQAKSESAARRIGEGDVQFLDRAAKQKRLAELAAQDPSLSGKLTRGVTSAVVGSLPYVAAGPGGVPALAATGAAMSLGEPENAPLNVALSTLPAPALGKFVPPILRRIRAGRNVPVAEEVAPAVEQAIPPAAQANPVVQRAMAQFEAEVERIKSLPKAQQATEMEAAIRRIGREAAGGRPAPTSVYPPQMVMPENPNAIQQAGVLPRMEADMALPKLEADLGVPEVRAAPDLPYKETVGPRLSIEDALKVKPQTGPPPVTPEERAALMEAEWEQFGRQPRQTPLLEGIPGPATDAERAALLASSVGKSKPAGQQNLFTGAVAAPAERTPIMQTISSLVKAGMLTKPTTHLKNLGGNLGFQISEEVARIPGAIVDMMVSPFTRRRTLTGPNLGSVARSAYQAATKGRQEAFQILRTGKTPVEIEGLQEIASGSKVIDGYVNRVFRLLKAEDAVFKSYALKRALEDRTRAAVLTEIRQGATPRSQYAQRFRELMKYPPADIASGAVLDAEVATFNNANITGSIRTGITKTLEKFGKKYPAAKPVAQTAEFAIDRIIPFAKTPANVIARMLDYTPVGAARVSTTAIARRLVGKSMTAEQQRQFSQTFGRAAAGSGILALGYVGYRDGWLTGMQEDDTSKRARDTATGRIPGAILIGRTWHQIAGTSPIASVLAIGATLAREAEQEQQKAKEEGKESGYLKKAGTALKVAGQAALEQPLLAGTKQLTESVQQPGTAGARYLGGIAGSAVPGIVSDVGQFIDYGKQREAQTLTERVMQRIPGVRQTLPEKLDALGRPMEAPFPLDPTRGSTAQQLNNPFFAELVRLDAGISGFQKGEDETDTAYRAKVQNFGQLYTRYGQQLVASPQYQRATDEIRLRAVKILNEKAKSTAKEGRSSNGALSPAALIGAAKGEEAREKAKKNLGKR